MHGNSYIHLAQHSSWHNLHSIDYDPEQPEQAIQSIKQYVADNQIDLIIGASLGGFLAMHIFGVPRIVVNPCWNPAVELPLIGYTGPIEEYEDILAGFPMFHDYEEYHLCSGCFADNDELLGTRYKDIFTRYFANVYSISDGHRISAQSAREIIHQHLPHHTAEVKDFCTKLKGMDNAPWWDEL